MRVGSLHVVRLSDPYTRGWKWLLYFAPYEGPLEVLPQRTCVGADDLQMVLRGLGLDGAHCECLIAEASRDAARSIPDVHVSDEQLRALGF
jgi:hypothetical protein